MLLSSSLSNSSTSFLPSVLLEVEHDPERMPPAEVGSHGGLAPQFRFVVPALPAAETAGCNLEGLWLNVENGISVNVSEMGPRCVAAWLAVLPGCCTSAYLSLCAIACTRIPPRVLPQAGRCGCRCVRCVCSK